LLLPLWLPLQDNAPLPSTRYRHMSDLLPPDNAAGSLDEWKAVMQAEVLRRHAQQQQEQQQQRQQQAPAQADADQPQLSAAAQILKCSWFSRAAPRV
jgi:transcription initiation factor TFIID subunit TAF12